MLGAERGELDREAGRGVLSAQRLLELGVAAVDPDPVARREGRHEERKAHDVIPVHVRHQDVVRLRLGRAVLGHRADGEFASAGAEVAEQVLGPARVDLDAGGVAAEGRRLGEAQLLVAEGRRLLRRVEVATLRALDQRGNQFSRARSSPRAAWAAIRAFPRRPPACRLRFRERPRSRARAGPAWRAPRAPSRSREAPGGTG